ncbi:acyl-CoA thioesterase [Piscirickettsia litoralis]|uniref:Thioesterase n=1 Tax=Piscirickettsia litoralis TaxID=1891921 RepID=A0ABX2ZXK1_9GAMM|nr:thioesterase family protein [Piscirickettsia litoralis]ODN41344.1 hypothetical protein BGC07_16365 [Piscirickettsia litoralis]
MIYTTSHRILESQIDSTGHLSNVQYYAFFKSAFYEFLNENNFVDLVSPKNLWPIVFHENCSFKKELYFNETIEIKFYFTDLSSKHNKWTAQFIMYDDSMNEVAIYESHHGILDKDTRKISSLPQAAIDLVNRYMK